MLIAWNNLQWVQPCEILGEGNKYVFSPWNQKVYCLGGAPWKLLLHKDMSKAVIFPTFVFNISLKKARFWRTLWKGVQGSAWKKLLFMSLRNLQHTPRKPIGQKLLYICLTQNLLFPPWIVPPHGIPVNMSHNQCSVPHILGSPTFCKAFSGLLGEVDSLTSLLCFLNRACLSFTRQVSETIPLTLTSLEVGTSPSISS